MGWIWGRFEVDFPGTNRLKTGVKDGWGRFVLRLILGECKQNGVRDKLFGKRRSGQIVGNPNRLKNNVRDKSFEKHDF